jgi:predicted ATPase/DNA-binding SARP family transcriptional activator
LLGPLVVVVDGTQIEVAGQRLRAVLIRLAMTANEVVPSGTLIDDAWDGAPPEGASATVQSHISRIRRLIGADRVRFRDGGYVLLLDDDESEVGAFEADVAAAQRARSAGQLDDAVRFWTQALRRWRGVALGDVAGSAWAAGEAARLDGLRAAATQDWLEARLEVGDHAGVIADAESAVATFPLQEGLWAALMLALYRSGRQSDALRAFQRLRSRLGEELGIEPNASIRGLEEAILLQKPELDWLRPPESEQDRSEIGRVSVRAAHNLPSQLSSFVGRTEELVAVRNQVEEYRLVTLVGVGGVGKTRLALEVAREFVGRLADGVWLVELARFVDLEGIVAEVARVLGVRNVGGLDELVAAIGDREVLILVDNCEHMLEAAARLAQEVGRGCPGARLLVTSRERLDIDGEHVWRVPALSLPPAVDATATEMARWGAIELFVDRARAQDPTFRLDGSNAEVIAHICRRLDGIPLAVELASARVGSMSLIEVARRLDDRFELLTVPRRSGPPRHQTLEATFEWSYNLLGDAEQVVLGHLAVFAGTWDLSAAESVLGATAIESPKVAQVITSLVDKGLVSFDVDPAGVMRYRLLETVRQFAFQRLVDRGEGVVQAVRKAHATTFLLRTERAAPHLEGLQQAHWLQETARDYENIKAALTYLLESSEGTVPALRLCVAVYRYWVYSGRYREAREAFERAIDGDPGEDPARRSAAASSLAQILIYVGEWSEAKARYEQALDLADQAGATALRAWALSGLGTCVQAVGGPDSEAARCADDAVAAARECGDANALGAALLRRALSWSRSHPAPVRQLADAQGMYDDLREATALFNRSGNWRMLAVALTNWAILENADGRTESSTGHLRRAFELASELQDEATLSWVTGAQGEDARRRGDLYGACGYFALAIRMFYRSHNTMDVLYNMSDLVLCLTDLGATEVAAQLRGAVARHGEASGPLVRENQADYDANEEALIAALGEDDYERLHGDGYRWTLGQAADRAVEAARARRDPRLE